MHLYDPSQQLRHAGVDLLPRVRRVTDELGHHAIPDGRRDVLRRSTYDLVGVRLETSQGIGIICIRQSLVRP